jgi:hypothetical protein
MGEEKKKEHTKYYNSKGQQVPSCTTVLQILNTPSLIYWSNKIGRQGKSYSAEMGMYSRIGTGTHLLIEHWFKGVEETHRELIEHLRSCSDYEKAQAFRAYNNFLRWADENEFELLGSELQLVSDVYNYGGTIDYYGLINGKLMIMDFKTSNYFNKKMFLQLAGYVNLLKEHGYEVHEVMILKLSKNSEEFWIKSKTVEELEEYFKLFKFCLATHKVDAKIEKEWKWNK